jgi:Protein of unknown function with HXXEE motif
VNFDATHGRWPWIAAATAPFATLAAWQRRDDLARDASWAYWLPLPALLWHQTEEWVKPGGFLPWFNREVLGSGEDEFPITRGAGLLINTGLGWALALAAGLTRESSLAGAQLAMLLGNAAVHLGAARRQRRYNPGSASAALLFVPIGVAGTWRLAQEPAPRRPLAWGVGAGMVASGGLMACMKLRLRGR